MDLKKSFPEAVRPALAVIAGNFLYALVVKLFLLPTGLATGGTTGLALVAEHLWGVPVSLFVLVFNVVMLLAGLLILGKTFALTTLASSFLYPIFLEVCNRIFGDLVLTRDLLLCTVFTGLGVGAALGIVIRAGASTGGMDIPALVLQKWFRIPVSASIYVFDMGILLLQLLFSPVENVLYGVLLALIYSTVLDKVLLLGSSRTEVKIISQKSRMISEQILEQLDRGVTLVNSEGGYLHTPMQIVFSVISNRELVRLERIVRAVDPECFMVVSRVSEVRGRGFSMKKLYQQK